MIAVSFTELALQWRIFWFAFKALYRGIGSGIYAASRSMGKEITALKNFGTQSEEDYVEDSAAPEDQVKMWMWIPGLLLSIVCICVVLGVEFEMVSRAHISNLEPPC